MSDQPTCDFSDKPTLHGERVILRPFTGADVPAMIEILADPEVLRLTGSPEDEEPDADHLRSWYSSRSDQNDRLDLAVVDRKSGVVVGEAVLHDWSPTHRCCRFRILIGPLGRDRGFGTEATRLIVGHGFERLGLNRIELSVYDFNPRARRAYEEVGFVAEGTEREVLHLNGEWFDATAMSVLAREWAVHRGTPEISARVSPGITG
ncbi:GNAT family N-acetyltransferase [Streptomyces sp. NPDC057638]|uniref:GNAT family N-acetyltransferase n=1 Tax=Streptomyces sp. NPDC057638 TaxID=3346190 RepID=UPI003699A075